MRGCTHMRAGACAPEGSPVGAGVRVCVGAGEGGQLVCAQVFATMETVQVFV